MGITGAQDFRLGVSKVFIRKPQTLYKFEEAREAKLHDLVRLSSFCFALAICQTDFLLINQATMIRKVYKGYMARKDYKKLRSAIKIQKIFRG